MTVSRSHRLNNRVRSTTFIWAPMYSCTNRVKSATLHLPPYLGSCTGALLVSRDRRHLFVTPWP